MLLNPVVWWDSDFILPVQRLQWNTEKFGWIPTGIAFHSTAAYGHWKKIAAVI